MIDTPRGSGGPGVASRDAPTAASRALAPLVGGALRVLVRARLPKAAAADVPPVPSVEPARSAFVSWVPASPEIPGPLDDGLLVVKDTFDVAGLSTRVGLDFIPPPAAADAELVRRVRAAGARLVAKTCTTELAFDGLGAVVRGGSPEHPTVPGCFAGGSSTGTAIAVASGHARYGLGGDGMGSVRIPASFCGLVGLKPSAGRLPIAGYHSPAPAQDVPGPMARTVADLARLFHVLDGRAPQPMRPRAPRRIGLVSQLPDTLAVPAVRLAFRRALAALPSEVVTVDVPGADRATRIGACLGIAASARSAYAGLVREPSSRLLVAVGAALSNDDVAWLEAEAVRLRGAVDRALERVDVLATPTVGVPAPGRRRDLLRGAPDLRLQLALGAYTPLANVTGLPAITVPVGVDAHGRSLGLMFFGSHGAEDALLEAAAAVESRGLAGVPVHDPSIAG